MCEPRPDWSPLGVNFKILDDHTHLFLYSSHPPPPTPGPASTASILPKTTTQEACTESLVNNNVHCKMQYACEKQWQTDGQNFNPVRCYMLFCKFDCLFIYLFIYYIYFFFEVKWKGVG